MNVIHHIIRKVNLVSLPCIILCAFTLQGQEANEQPIGSDFSLNTSFHNQLFFNRFLINPTFSLVREDKSYLNILHRNQYATYEDNNQSYYLGFSNKLNENTAVGIGVYGLWNGVMQEFGFNANYATSVKTGAKSKLTFGTNITYLSEGLDRNRVVSAENDPSLLEAKKENKISVQPGISFSTGRFDFGLYAMDMVKYNQTTNNLETNFNDKSVKVALQYAHPFQTTRGLFADARFMPLLQIGKNETDRLSYIASLLLDLPNYGWLQTTYDDTYGMSLGLGFNISQKLSLGYLMEKSLLESGANLGWNHELSLAYTFKEDVPQSKSFADGSTDQRIDEIVRNYEEQILKLKADVANRTTVVDKTAVAKETRTADLANNRTTVVAKTKVAAGTGTTVEAPVVEVMNTSQRNNTNEVYPSEHSLAYENRLILDELILRQDSIEKARNQMFEKRFETIVRLLRNDIKQNKDDGGQDSKPGIRIKTAVAKAESTKPKNIDAARNKKYNDVTAFTKANKEGHIAKTEPKKQNNTLHPKYEKFAELPIKSKNRSDIIGVNSGYYMIVNVYKNKKYLNAFINSLTEQGLDARQFYNKENGLYYVYLADFKTKDDAKIAAVSHLNGKYDQEKWIMEVYNPVATAGVGFENQ